MNNKGFTLTELLVTIAIMGIITGLAFPSIRKLQEENKSEEFKAYEKVLVNAAKVYMDSHSNEIEKGKCWVLSDNYLVKYGLIKEKSLKSGYTSESKIMISKDGDGNITYSPNIWIKKGNKYVYKTYKNLNYPTCTSKG